MATMITFHVPTDKDLLAAFGEVALRHEHLNHILRMTLPVWTAFSQKPSLNARVQPIERNTAA